MERLLANQKFKNPIKKIIMQRRLENRIFAALTIQRVFRGFHLRKAEFLKRLANEPRPRSKQLAELFETFVERVKSSKTYEYKKKDWLLIFIR